MSLFKYMGATASQGFLSNLSVRFTQPKAYNDPFEMSPKFYSKGGNDLQNSNVTLKLKVEGQSSDINNIIVTENSEFNSPVTCNFIDQINENIGVTCFSHSETETTPENLLMWAHYSESHRGISVEFKDNIFSDPFVNKVRYEEKRPLFNAEILTDDSTLHISDFFFKSKHWKYEAEFRCVKKLDECTKLDVLDNGGYPIYLSKLQVETINRIFVGVNASPELKTSAHSFYQQYGITIVFLGLAKNEFKLIPTRVFSTNPQKAVQKCMSEYQNVECTFPASK